MWKFILINFTAVDLKGQLFNADNVWKGALRRYASKVNSLTFKVNLRRLKAEARGKPINVTKNKLIAPLATIDEMGVIQWSSEMAKHFKLAGLDCGGAEPHEA